MIELTSEARELLDRYLRRTRISLGGTSVDADEIESDVRAHIDEALADRTDPVSAADLAEVLDRLGSPMQWVPDEEISIWRRTMANLSDGPEDWRLAYLCFGMTLLGFLTLPLGIGIFILAAAVFLSRASISLAEEKDEPLGARRWLVYPPLVFFSVLVLLIPLIGPVGGLAALVSETWPNGSGIYTMLGVEDSLARVVALVVGVVGAWWIIFAGIAAIAAKPIRWLFFPLTARYRPVHAAWLALVGVVLILGSGAVMMIL